MAHSKKFKTKPKVLLVQSFAVLGEGVFVYRGASCQGVRGCSRGCGCAGGGAGVQKGCGSAIRWRGVPGGGGSGVQQSLPHS